MWLVVTWSNGHKSHYVYGIFATHYEAVSWAAQNLSGYEYAVTRMISSSRDNVVKYHEPHARLAN